MKKELAIGIIGTGGFAGFAAKSFLSVSGIRVLAVTDLNENAAIQLANELQAQVYSDYEKLLQDERINLIYIVTPPYLHYAQSKQALLAGKHVICEKPASLNLHEAQELVSLAHSRKLLYTVNLMQRYNPLFKTVQYIIQDGMLGDFLHGFFENYACDEKLIPDHWFWDKKKSGGIFIERGVHFFDLFEGWLGKGEVAHAQQWERPDSAYTLFDRVQATVVYPKGPVNFYHAFDQPKLLDRQEMRLQFERGDLTLYEWVPVKMRLHGLIQNDKLEKLKERLGDCTIVQHDTSSSTSQHVMGRSKEIEFDQFITLEHGSNSEKEKRYQQLLTDMICDQWKWIQDPTHVRVIDGKNAIESMRIAERATKISEHE